MTPDDTDTQALADSDPGPPDADAIRGAVLAVLRMVAPETDLQALRPSEPLRPQVDLDSMDWIGVASALQERLRTRVPGTTFSPRASLDSIVASLAAARPLTPRAAKLPRAARHVLNGTAVRVRPMRRDDAALEAGFVRRLSEESRYERFMAVVRELSPAKLDYLTDVDQSRHVALVATVERDDATAIVGVVRYIVDAAGTGCEFAATVDDAWHGTGLAAILMRALIAVARARGLSTMEGVVLSTNRRMLAFARQLGFEAVHDPADRATVRVVRTL